MGDQARWGPSPTLDAAVQRLDFALSQFEIRFEAALGQARIAADAETDQDRAKLAAELDAARGRERELEIAGSQASRALGQAIADIRDLLGEEEG